MTWKSLTITEQVNRMKTSKNGMRPIHPGEVLREEFLIPLNLTAHALALALHVPAPRINDIVREHRAAARHPPPRLHPHRRLHRRIDIG